MKYYVIYEDSDTRIHEIGDDHKGRREVHDTYEEAKR